MIRRVKGLFSRSKGEPPLAKKSKARELSADETRLVDFLLSPASSTQKQQAQVDGEGEGEGEDDALLLEAQEICELMERLMPGARELLDRTRRHKLLHLLCSTYDQGLPLYSQVPAVQRHSRDALRAVVNQLAFGGSPHAAKYARRLTDAFQACQAEQGRTIDALFGVLCGRDKSLRDVVLERVVDPYKGLVMEQVAHSLNPRAAHQGDGVPQAQIPHIVSSYCASVGEQLGMRGVEASRMDHCRFELDDAAKRAVLERFRELFSVQAVVDNIIADVNQQEPDAERLIDRELLTRWAGEYSGAFDAHSLFYDEEERSYPSAPTESNKFQPFLCPQVTTQLLLHLLCD